MAVKAYGSRLSPDGMYDLAMIWRERENDLNCQFFIVKLLTIGARCAILKLPEKGTPFEGAKTGPPIMV